MVEEFSHLEPSAVEALLLPKAERIEACRADRWIGYTRATQIIAQLDELLIYPKTLRMPNILVVGRSGNGKSSILERFTSRHPILITEAGAPVAPILKFEMPETPTEDELWSAILGALAITHRKRDLVEVKKQEAKSAMTYASVRMLVIDEFNNLQNAGKHAPEVLAALKGISNTLKISLVVAGIQTSINVLNNDPQMKTRFEPAPLDRWTLDKEYLRFLLSYERLLPLAEPSGLGSRELAPIIYGMCGDTIGSTVKLLKAAASYAIEHGKERIDEKILRDVPWTKPGEWDDIARRI